MAATKMTRLESAAAEAAAAVIEARQVLEEWRARSHAAQAELDDAEAMPGDALLDDPRQAAAWPARLRELRDQVAAATRAAAAQEQRVQAAERAWCRARATLLEDVEVAPAWTALTTHQERTRELLAALEEHNGPYVPAVQLARAQRTTGVRVVGATSAPLLPKEHALQVALARARVRYDVLAAMADGVDPAAVVAARSFAGEITEEDAYPEDVHATGLVPAPAYVRRVEAARALVDDLERLPNQLEAELADLADRAAREQWEPGVLEGAVARRQARLGEIPGELDGTRRELEALTGAPVAVAPAVAGE